MATLDFKNNVLSVEYFILDYALDAEGLLGICILKLNLKKIFFLSEHNLTKEPRTLF